MDGSTVRTLILVFFSLVVFGSLIGLVDVGFTANLKSYSNPQEQIDNWYGSNLNGTYGFQETWNKTLAWGVIGSTTFSLGGRNLRFYEDWRFGDETLQLGHRYGFGLFFIEMMDWYFSNQTFIGSELKYYHIDDAYENGNATFKVQSQGLGSGSTRFFVTAMFWFNTTLYDYPSEAWQNNDLHILIGINPQNSNMQLDLWYLLTMLMTFNTYEIFGTNEGFAHTLNYIIGALAWAMAIIPIALMIKELFSNWL